MKKTKILVATLTAATLAIGCAALVACGDPEESPKTYDITFNANGGSYTAGTTTVVETDENGVIVQAPANPTREHYTFSAYNTAENGSGNEVKFGEEGTKFTADATVWAQWTENVYTITLDAGDHGTLAGDTELSTAGFKLASLPTPTAGEDYYFVGWYTAETDGEEVTTETVFEEDTTIYALYQAEVTVTLSVGEGTLEAGAVTSYKTVNGKINATLPEPSIATENWSFDNWYDAEENGNAVNEKVAVFTADTTLYARYVRDNGIWVDDEFKIALVQNTYATGVIAEYWLGSGNSLTLNEGDEIYIYIGGKLISNWASGTCVTIADKSNKVDSVTVSENATFVFYVKHYESSTDPENWVCEYQGRSLAALEVTNETPEGSQAVTITGTNGTITLYLKINGVAVNSDNAANYQIHAWQDSYNNIFGGWDDNPTLADEDDLSVNVNFDDDLQVMFHWSGGQSGAVSKLEVNKSFVVTIDGDSSTVKIYEAE